MADREPGLDLKQIDELMLELIERRLSEKVTARVETALKWRYGLLAAAFGSALIVAGLVWSKIIDSAMDGVVQGARTSIEEEIRKLTKNANESSGRVDLTLALAEKLAEQGSAVVKAAKQKLVEVEPAIEAINDLEDRQKDLDARTKDLVVTVGSKPIPLLVDDLRTKLATLGEQVDRLGQILAQLPGADQLKAKDGATTAQVQSDAANLVRTADDQRRVSADAQKMPTVFIQFAGASREQAQELGAALRAAGYNVPPEDRESAAARRHEVRFFNPQDAAAADTLVKTANKALADLGYRSLTVQKEDVTDFRGQKPQPGVVELWIELPGRTPKS